MNAKQLGKQIRKQHGFFTVEMVFGMLVLIPVIILFLDLAIIFSAVQINNETCRELARVAACGSPSDMSARTKAVMAHTNQTKNGLLSVKLVNVDCSASDADVKALEPLGGPLDGTVTVTSEVEVRPYFVDKLVSGPLHFKASHTLPLTYVVPNTAT